MSRRKNKKLMVGLGSTLIFSSTAIMGAFGLKSIVDNFTNQANNLANQINSANFRNVDEIPDFNLVKESEIGDWSSMLFDTSKYAKQMHFGSTEKGQTLTPWGWLGAGSSAGSGSSKDYYPTTVFLTSWNGEILWVNDEFKNLGDKIGADAPRRNPVYDLKYDWNTDTVFVLRTTAKNGLLEEGQTENVMPARIDILKGSTGEKIATIDNKQLFSFRQEALKILNDSKLFYNGAKTKDRLNNLYSLDIASSSGIDNRVFVTYKPNFLKLIDKEGTDPNHHRRNLIWSHRVLEYWDKLQITFEINPLNNVNNRVKKVNYSFGDDQNGDDKKDILVNEPSSQAWKFKYGNQHFQMGDTSLIANPFNTVSNFGHLITHFFFADDKANVYHLYYANRNTGDKSHDWNDYTGVEKVGDLQNKSDVEGVVFSLLNDDEKNVEGGYWGDAIRWDNKIFSTANLIVNRNMFDTNSVTFAYPYAASLDPKDPETAPAFNVASLMIDFETGKIMPSTGKYKADFLKSTIYEFGKQSYEYWKKHKNSYSSPNEGISIIYPWPNSTNDSNWNMRFNRLISVSPFDNTVIFAGMTPFRSTLTEFNPDQHKGDYAPFWVGTTQITDKNKPLMRPFIVANNSSNGGEIDGSMIAGSNKADRLSNLYKKGFTFDLNSLNSINTSDYKANINIYFSQSAQPSGQKVQYKDDNGKLTNGVVPVSKIGLLDNPFKNAEGSGSGEKFGWTTNVTSLYGNKNSLTNFVQVIKPEKFSSLIHSRARVDEWIKRSWFNINNGANALKADYVISPTYKSDDEHAAIYQWNKNLKNSLFKTNAGAELLSNWKTGNGGKNFDLLDIKQGVLKVLNKNEKDKLFLELSFSPSNTRTNKYQSLFYNSKVDVPRLTWKKEFTVQMPSVQYFTSWGSQIKATGVTTSIDNFSIVDNWEEPKPGDEWIDARKSPDKAVFGKSHNALSVNARRPLRTVLRIKNPATGKNKPNWWNPDEAFFNWYPGDAREMLSGETEFKTILQKFVEWKVKNIDLSEKITKTGGFGLANITIEAGLQFNPAMFPDATTTNVPIYKVNDTKYVAVTQAQLNGKTVPKYLIYDDQYNDSRAIYKQEQTNYDNIYKGGYGDDVYEELKKSWDETRLESEKSSRLIISSSIGLLQNKLVRPNDKHNKPVIKAKYVDTTKKKIKIEPADDSVLEWFSSVFDSYNIGLNLFAKFEYKLKDSTEWKMFDFDVKDTDKANTGWTFDTNSNEQIEQVRFRLIQSKTAGSFEKPEKDYIEWKNFNADKDSANLISDPAYVQGIPINFQSSWITNEKITSKTNDTLDHLSVADLTEFENKILEQVVKANNNNNELKNVLEFTYSIGSNKDLTKDQFVSKIIELLNNYGATDGGIFSLWNGTNNNNSTAYKINVKVQVKKQNQKDYVLSENNQDHPNGIAADAKSDIKTKVDLTNYLSWLKNEKLNASKGATAGEMSNVQIQAAKLQDGLQFNKKTFDEMVKILANIGIKFQFKQWDPATKNWETNWKDNLNQITKYNPNDPKIMLGLNIDTTNFNVKVVDNGTDINNGWAGIQIALNLPKTVTVDLTKLQKTLEQAITGDTHSIDITNTQAAIDKAIDEIIKDNEGNQTGSFANLRDRLNFSFSLASSGFKSFNELKTTVDKWAENENEQTNNELKVKIELSNQSSNKEFEFINNQNPETTIHANENTVIKKWLFGNQYEKEITNIIIDPSTTSKNDIKYTYPNVFDDIRQDKVTYLKLEWKDATKSNFADSQNNEWKDIKQEALPSDVSDGKIQKIQIRVADTNDNDQYIYGPEKTNQRRVQEIDFSKLKTLVEVNPNWFTEVPIIEDNANIITIQQLKIEHITQWEQRVLNKISVKDPQILSQIEIQYQFIDNIWKSKNELITKIQDELTKPSTIDREILQLWDGVQNQNNGIKIKAKFAIKNQNSNVIFVDNNKKPITDDTKLTGDVNSQKIYTEVNLINYLDLLMKTEIDVEPKTLRDPNATPNIVEINGIKLPNNSNEGLFKHKTWAEISRALTAKKIKILFSKDKAAWYEPENITSYDANAGILWMAIENNASNLYVQYQQGQQPIAPLKDNKANPLFIRLNVQKVLNIEYSDFEGLIKTPSISGNTKKLNFDNNNKIIKDIEDTVKKIKEKNKQNTGNPDYDRVPLVLKFSLGNSGWHSINDLKGFLAKQTQDQETRILKAKFFIEGTEQEQKNWILGGQTEFDLLPESNNPLKIYIHDQGIYSELAKAQLSGDNTNLTWTWAKLSVDPISGIITKPDKKSTLKVEYSLDNKTWTTTQTKSFNVGTQEMWIRLVLADDKRYEYETTNIKQEIKIDLSKIKQILDVASAGIDTTDFVDSNMDISNLNSLNTFTQWEEKVRKILKPTSANPPKDWQKLIQFEYQLDVWSNTKHWADANTFLSELKQYQQNQSGDTLGILQLWNGTSGHKVSVRLKLANPQNNINYELRVDGKKPEDVPKVVKTEKIITTIDFKEVYLWLKDIKLTIDRTDTNTFKKMHWEKINAIGSRFNNKSWDDAIKILNKLNVEIQYRDFTKDNKPKSWVNDYNKLNSFGSNADFQMKFILKANGAKNIKFKLSDNEIVEGSSTARESKEFNVQLKAPKFINLDTKVIDQFKTQKVFWGDTKNLEANRAAITKLIEDLKKANSNITNVNNAHLKVYFALGKTPGNEKSNWFEIQDFITKLADDKFNQASNQINMRFFVANTDLNNPEFITDNKMIIFKDHTNPEQVDKTHNNELMYYINDAQWESDLAKISVSGSTQELVWNFNNLAYQLEKDQTVLITNQTANHKGLHLEWTADENAKLDAPSATQNDLKQGWTKAQPKDIAADIKTLWIRVVAENGFIYGPAQNKKNQKHKIDLSNIHRIVKLDSTWLNSIEATGNLAQLKLDESKAKQKLIDAKVLPPDEIDNLVFEYTIDEKEWSTREKFEQLIIKKQGSGASGFILRREELKMRFGLKAEIAPNKYGFEIDGKIVNTEDDFKKHYKQLIDDGRSINSSVFGIINMNFVEAFSISNFIILGTNNIPRLKILNQEKMLNAFNPYASDHIFSLEITTTFDQTNNQWDWTKKAEIWNGQSFETNLAKFGLTINSDKKAALRLVIKTDKYGVFGDQNTLSLARANQNQNTSKAFQKLLDLSSNIYITVEIDNPFEQQGKGLAIQTRDQNKKAKWKQGEGEFRIVVGDQNNGTPDTNDQDAQAFIDASTIANKEKLELVYKAFESKPSATEIQQFQRAEVINDYNNPLGWKTFKSKKDATDQKEWSDGLNLKVGNYVMVALRVKKEYADPKNNPHILKGEKHSVLIPVQGAQTPGRIAGYLVDPADAPIKKETIHLESMKDNLVGYLDGYTQLKSLALEKDEKGTIEGIELKLQLYNDFHRDQNGDILVSGSGAKLVKRIESGMEKGKQYTDKNGGLINDKDGNGVFAYTDPQTKCLSSPEEYSTKSKTLPFATSGNGVFVIPLLNNPKYEDEFSLFRNQKIEILYEAKQGEGTKDLPDFELSKDSNNTENLQDVISPQIKFAIENTQNVKYAWNYDEYADNVLEYESSTPGTSETVSGFSKFKTPLKIKKITGSKEEIITGKDGAESAANLEKMLKDDFKDQLQFSYSYIRKSGSEIKNKNTANIYKEEHLENGDRIILTIEAVDHDLIYTEAPKPLILNVKGLMTDAPEQDKLQFLRVEQSGVINGKGSFRLLVNDPLKPNEDNQSILKNWKFLLRVWDGKTDEKGEHKIKINWTEDQTKLVNLSNGDKVEWKLVDKNDNHVQDGYYNTVAGEHQSGPNGQVIFNFMQVNYPNGPEDKVVVSPGIGAYPAKEDENKYPEKSGFVIGGLQEKLTRFDLTQSAFEKIIRTLGPYYKGVDGHGVLNFNPKFFEGTWWVNHNGDVYQKEQNQPTTWADQIMDQPAEITLDQFFAHTTFYTKNPAVVPTQIGWQFASNDTALDNYLSNSNQLWARFDVMQPQANLEKSLNLKASTPNDPAVFDGFLIAQLPAVANLKTVTDPMSPLWWVLISLGMLITFGTLFIIVWKQKYKKLKDPKI